MQNATRNDVKQLAQKIELLAKEVGSRADGDGDFLLVANELTRNNITLIFTLGEVYALERLGGKKKSVTQESYHNVRDIRGRFTKKI